MFKKLNILFYLYLLLFKHNITIIQYIMYEISTYIK